jgi:hypothetical protein
VIGVIANPSGERIVREFFELFKTPWEFFRDAGQYDVVLCAGGPVPETVSAQLLVVYGGDQTPGDSRDVPIATRSQSGSVLFGGTTIPLYGSVLTFVRSGVSVLEDYRSGEAVAYVAKVGDKWVARIGYDLFYEVQTLLTQGQPAANASIPALELHIAVLRNLITGCGLPLIEIPPVPAGYSFIACLTHDLDHALIRRHKFDATMFGFLYRATVASAINTVRGRMPFSRLLTNLAAVAKLPLVYLGLAEDTWCGFDRYLDLEDGRPSTFFVIPFARRPGSGRPDDAKTGRAPAARGVGYDVFDVAARIRRLAGAGCEIGLHGIDAWNDKAKALEEAKRVSDVSATRTTGVRMHWLYSDQESPAVLEEADFSYDSTVGYNETVGYRAGTGQVFKPFRAARLLELPLHVMDTALFYADYLNLTEDEASAWLAPFLDNGVRYGGVLTVNWHDRSISPERLWDTFYVGLLAELTRKGAQFCTASQTVSWFQRRRSAVFERSAVDGEVRVNLSAGNGEGVPALRLRFHRPKASPGFIVKSDDPENSYTDTILSDRLSFVFKTVESKTQDIGL